jgi:hypothetical protein
MNLAITDKQAFATLNPFEVKAYLVDTGWQEDRVLPKLGSFWRHAENDRVEVPLPYDKSVADFTDRMRDAVEVLADFEKRPQLEILKDLEWAGQDVVRVRLVRTEIEDGTLPLEQGVEFLESARNAVYASACAAASKHRRAYYYSRPPKAVTDFMEGVRLGQTERGSYVVAIETPIAPELQEQTGQIPEPFARTVTRTLAGALETLREAATRGNAKAIESAVSAGVSANLCSSMAEALHLSGSQGEVEVRVSWARTRRVAESTPRKISFPSYLKGVISEAAELLRSIAEIDNFELIGTVYQLRQNTEAVILGLVDDHYRKVRVEFPSALRDQLIDAFNSRSIIRCIGELRQVGKITELTNAREFSVDEADEAEPA